MYLEVSSPIRCSFVYSIVCTVVCPFVSGSKADRYQKICTESHLLMICSVMIAYRRVLGMYINVEKDTSLFHRLKTSAFSLVVYNASTSWITKYERLRSCNDPWVSEDPVSSRSLTNVSVVASYDRSIRDIRSFQGYEY